MRFATSLSSLLGAAALFMVLPAAAAQNWFEGFSNYPITGTANFVALGDWDGDQVADLLTLENGVLQAWLQTGSKAQVTPGPLTSVDPLTLIEGRQLQAADLDGDGRQDLVTWRASTPGGVVVLRGNGDGSFTPDFFATGGLLRDLTLGDFNSDGKQEIGLALAGASAVAGLHTVSYVSGTLQRTAFVATVDLSSSLATMDWNGDGFDDLVCPKPFQGFTVGRGGINGLQGLIDAQAPGFASTLVGADFDGDGRGDLLQTITTSGLPRFLLYTGRSGSVPGPPLTTNYDPFVERPLAGDWDGDGDLDLVALTQGGGTLSTITVFRNDQGEFPFFQGILTSDLEPLPALGDLDGDGLVDAVLPQQVLFSPGEVEFPWADQGFAPGPDLQFVDWEGDGDIDRLAEGGPPFGLVRLNNGAGEPGTPLVSTPSTPLGFGYSNNVVGIGDFTGEGQLDFLAEYEVQPFPFGATTFIEWRLLADDGTGQLEDLGAVAPGSVPGPGPAPSSFASTNGLVVDLDGDGDQDLVNGRRAWINTGGPAFPGFGPGIVISSGDVLSAGDLDGDGDLDLVALREGQPDRLAQLTNLGGLNFSSSLVASDPAFDGIVRTLDLDGDGDLDLAARVAGAPARILFAENRGGTLVAAGQVEAYIEGGPDNFAVEDVNEDGVLDLLSSRLGGEIEGGAIEVHLGLGPPLEFERAATFDVRRAVSGFADADGDGDLDAWTTLNAARNTRASGPEAGRIRQYGAGSPGAGGITPVLGATGPWQVGTDTAEIRIVRGLGGAPVFLAVSGSEDLLPNFPLPGLTLLVSPGLVGLPQFVMSPGGPGEGRLTILVTINNPALAGLVRFRQAFLVDAASPSLLSASNGLELGIGD